MDSLSEVSAYLNELESMLDDGESPMKKEDLVKEGTEIERIDAMEIVENVPKKVKHEVVVFTKAPYHEYCEPCIRSSTPCMVKGNQAWDAELNMAYYDSYMSEDMLNTLGYVRLDHGEYGRKMVKNVRVMIHGSFLLTTKSQVDFRIGEMRVDVTMLKEEMDIDTLLTNFVEDMDEVGDTSGELVKMGKANRLKSNNKGSSSSSRSPPNPLILKYARRETKRTIHFDLQLVTQIMEMEPDIENMTLNEYLEYEAKKERRSWRNARSKRAEKLRRMGQEKVQNGCDDDTSRDTNHESGNLLNFPIFLATNEFSSICEQDVDLEKEEAQVEDDDDEDTYDIWDIWDITPNVPDEIDEVIQPLIPQPLHT
ncbi:hypothetical protein Tco_0942345, partial [Tanacetum coccineum]